MITTRVMPAAALRPALPLLACLLFLAAASGCQAPPPGVKSVYGSQYATLDAAVPDATEAAAATLRSMGLEDVQATATEVDGEITGYTPERTRVEVYAAQEDEGRTEVSVMVGEVGEPALGTAIIADIRRRLGG